MIKTSYDTKDAIPEGFDSLYTEKDGKYVLTGVEGMKTQTDVDNVKAALNKERELRKTAEASLSAYDGVDSEGLRAQLDELARLRTTEGKIDDSKIESIVAERLKLDKNKFENDLKAMNAKLEEANGQVSNLVNEKNKNKIEKALRDAATTKINETAMNDLLFRASLFEVSEDGQVLTKDGVGVTPGQEPQQWLEETLKTNVHWQKTSKGGGATGTPGSRTSSKTESAGYGDLIAEQCTFN